MLLLKLRDGLYYLLHALPVARLQLLLHWRLVLVLERILLVSDAVLELVDQCLDVLVEFEADDARDHALLKEGDAVRQLLALLLDLDLEIWYPVELLLVVSFLYLDFLELLQKSIVVSVLLDVLLLLVLYQGLEVLDLTAELAYDRDDVIPREAVAALQACSLRQAVEEFADLLPLNLHLLGLLRSKDAALAIPAGARIGSRVMQNRLRETRLLQSTECIARR